MVAISIADTDPTSPYLLGNSVFAVNNNYLVQSGSSQGTVTYNGANSIIYTQNQSSYGIDQLGSNAVVGGNQGSVSSAVSFLFPDWIRAGWNWIKTSGRMFLNVIGAPYLLIAGSVQDSSLAALLQIFFGMLCLLIMINWILGKDAWVHSYLIIALKLEDGWTMLLKILRVTCL